MGVVAGVCVRSDFAYRAAVVVSVIHIRTRSNQACHPRVANLTLLPERREQCALAVLVACVGVGFLRDEKFGDLVILPNDGR